jgi:hypothetical protein
VERLWTLEKRGRKAPVNAFEVYNSNSFTHGLLNTVGIIDYIFSSFLIPGFDKPVPAHHFYP